MNKSGKTQRRIRHRNFYSAKDVQYKPYRLIGKSIQPCF